MNADVQALAESTFTDILDVFGVDAVISGDRRETGASESRQMKHMIRCIISDAQQITEIQNAIANTQGSAYEVKIGRVNWPDHTAPQVGDVVTCSGYPLLNCLLVLPTKYGWALTCNSKGAIT